MTSCKVVIELCGSIGDNTRCLGSPHQHSWSFLHLQTFESTSHMTNGSDSRNLGVGLHGPGRLNSMQEWALVLLVTVRMDSPVYFRGITSHWTTAETRQ